ncbi:MAG: RHS repeat-associated core domain-containing protein, partial [Bacteroidota bacterium]|nr:RHS repeat-associated core domain-containing protein [Bacteroidota bacterium]
GASDYYPFGMLQVNRGYSLAEYRFGFNGKEMDNEVSGTGNQYDYGFRIYNPRIAKFLSVDPLTKSYPWYTPYQFAGNKPIMCSDLDGLEEKVEIKKYNKNGELCLVTSYDLIKLTGEVGPLGSGKLIITTLQNENRTRVQYWNFDNEGKEGEHELFQYTALTKDLPKLVDYNKAPPKYTWESEVKVGAESSDKFILFGKGFDLTYGAAASLFYSNISEEGVSNALYNGASAEVGSQVGYIGGSVTLDDKFNLTTTAKLGPVHESINWSILDNSTDYSVPKLTIFEFSEVKAIGGNTKFTYDPTKTAIHAKNYESLKGYAPEEVESSELH